jgi:hypothetical protein
MPGTGRTRCPSAANRQLARHTAAYTAGLEFHDLFHHNRGSVPRCPACGDILGRFVRGHSDQPATSTGVTAGTARRSAARGRGALGGGRRSRTTRCLAEPAVRVQVGGVQPGIQQDLLPGGERRLVANRPPLGSTGCGTRPGRSIRQARSRLKSSQLRRALVEIESLGLWHRSKRGTWTPTYFPSAGGISQARS